MAKAHSNVPDGDLYVCIDRVVPEQYNPARAMSARATLDDITRMVATARPVGDVAGGELDAATDIGRRQRAAIVDLKKWPNGSILNCRFLDGDAIQRRKVEGIAHTWEQYANVAFRFVTRGDAEIRVSFTADKGSWSALGTDALVERYFPKYQPTMNFGWLRADTEEQEYSRVVLHEFGHALGLIHEHQNPKGELKWNRTEVLRFFSGYPNYWGREEIEHNILNRYSPVGITATRFDPDSIMLYMFPGSLFTDGLATRRNTHLSELDKTFIAEMYPRQE